MASTQASRRAVFRTIAQASFTEWPVYDSTPLYDRTSLAGLESDIRDASEAWFRYDEHDSIDLFVCSLPLAYFRLLPNIVKQQNLSGNWWADQCKNGRRLSRTSGFQIQTA